MGAVSEVLEVCKDSEKEGVMNKIVRVRAYNDKCDVVFNENLVEFTKVYEKYIRVTLLSGRYFDIDRKHYEDQQKLDNTTI